MPNPLRSLLAREQRAFLGRPRRDWGEHLDRIRAFLGQGLQAADPGRPVLLLGAGSGLEVPWEMAPRGTVGWDADPWSRLRTALRHRRWSPWVFEDLTGGFQDLEDLLHRNRVRPGSEHPIRPEVAIARLAGLLPTLHPAATALATRLESLRPGTLLSANVMGQFGVLAQRLVERAFGGTSPWNPDPELPDPLADAVEAWTAQAIRAYLGALAGSGAQLWLVHDRAVFHGAADLDLGPFTPRWQDQVRGRGEVEASDALAGLDVPHVLGREPDLAARWLWPVAPGQVHLMEAMAFESGR
jgi:hypothetical protein